MRNKMISDEKQSEFISAIEYYIDELPYDKIKTIYEICFDTVSENADWDSEEEKEYGDLFDEYIENSNNSQFD